VRKNELSIGIFEPVEEMTGGKAYRDAVRNILHKGYHVEVFNVGGGRGLVPSARIRRMLAIASVRQNMDIWIRDFYPIAGLSFRRNPGKNIGLFFHMYTEGDQEDGLGRILQNLFLRNIRKCDRVVAISKFWEKYLCLLGLNNVRLIRNGVDSSQFVFDDDEVEAFRRKHLPADAPIVYIGNCRKSKGVVEAYEALKDRGYNLVTSGKPDITLPCPNFNLPHREYLLLLRASSVVVTMSKFIEGWCITAQEAMLCRTPVVGSGAGGMAELLEEGKQLICRDIRDLPGMVEIAIRQKEQLGEEGYKFASTLTLERFESEWVSLIEDVARESSPPAWACR
jgi:glycosyltransferase involved in cell wall biosynthesis